MSFITKFISVFLAIINMIIVPLSGNYKYLVNKSITVEVNESVEYQTVSGFGASAAWWAQNCGDSVYADDVAKALYSEDGLGLTIYRYNVGGGEADNPEARVHGSRASESFYVYNEATGEYEYDFTRDAAAQAMLDKCLSYGCIDTVVLFANSPHPPLRIIRRHISVICRKKIMKLMQITLSQSQSTLLKRVFPSSI